MSSDTAMESVTSWALSLTARTWTVLWPSCKVTSAWKLPLLLVIGPPLTVILAVESDTVPLTRNGVAPTVIKVAGSAIRTINGFSASCSSLGVKLKLTGPPPLTVTVTLTVALGARLVPV